MLTKNSCGSREQRGFRRTPRCTSEKMNNNFTEYVLALETHNAGDIAFIKSIFDAEGIIYFIQGENVSPYLFNALPMRVMVNKDEVGKAKDILKDIKLSYSYNFGENSDNNQ